LILLIGMSLLHQKFISHSTTLRMIYKHFKLNFKQHKMFISEGLKFIESIANDFDINFELDSHSYFVNGQFIWFLAGGAAVNNERYFIF
jgi:hypothetical protein